MALKLADDSMQRPPEDPGEERNPWDVDREPVVISQPIISDSGSGYGDGAIREESIVIKVLGILLLVMYGITAAVMFMNSGGLGIDAYSIMQKKIAPVAGVLNLLIIADAFYVFFTYEKKASLLIMALLFQPLYIITRFKVVNGSGGFGTLASVVYILSIVGLMTGVVQDTVKYGGLIQLDDATRQEVSILYAQVDEGSGTYGDVISSILVPSGAEIVTQAGTAYLVIGGVGDISMQSGVFVQGPRNVNTVLAFAKNPTNGSYRLAMVQLNNQPLTERDMQSFWKLEK